MAKNSLTGNLLASRRQAHRKRSLKLEQLETRKVLSANWAGTFTSGEVSLADYDSARDIAIGSDGSNYVAGSFNDNGTIDFDDQSAEGEVSRRKKGGRSGADGFLVKYDMDGSFEWVVHATNGFNAYVDSVALDSQGNAYIAGTFNEPFDLYRNDVFQVSVDGMGQDMFLAKITDDGVVEWAESISGDRGYKIANGLEVREDGATGEVEILLWGMTAMGGDLDPGPGTTLEDAVDDDRHGFLGNYQYNGAEGLTLNWLAVKETGSTSGWLREIDLVQDQIVGVGFTETDSFVGIFDVETGELLEESLSSNATTLTGVDRNGNEIYISGHFTGGVDLDGDGLVDLVGDDARRGFISKHIYDAARPSGEQLSVSWGTVLSGGHANRLLDVKVSPSGPIYASGGFEGTLTGDGISLQASGEQDGLVVKLDPLSGALLSAVGLGGTGYEFARELEIDAAGAIHIVGSTDSPTIEFPNVPQTFATDGTTNGFVAVFTPTTSAPPIADAGPSQNGSEDQLLTFDASVSSDPDGDVLTYHWDFGDGETAVTSLPTASHAFSYGGAFDVTLTVLDGNGNSGTDVTTATIAEVNDSPVADIGGPYAGFATQAVTFDASGSTDYDNLDGTTANDQTLTYLWDFGDGITQNTSSATASHIYSVAGNFSVSVEVSDGIVTSPASFSTAAVQDAPTGDPSSIYVWSIEDAFETRQRGRNNTDHRVVLTVRNDTDGDGIAELTDAVIANVFVTVELRDSGGNLVETLSGTTGSDGVFRSSWIKGLDSGDYRVNVVDLALDEFQWDPFLDIEDEQWLPV